MKMSKEEKKPIDELTILAIWNSDIMMTNYQKEIFDEFKKGVNKMSEARKRAISLNEYYALKNGLDIYKKIPELEQEVSILERAIERLEIWA